MITVFISSTSADLERYRKLAVDACMEANLHPIDMKHFGPRPDDAVTTCRNEVERADLFIGIYAYRYGYVPDGYDYSITEMEYQWATERGLKRFCFLVEEGYTNKQLNAGRDDDNGAARRALKAFKEQIDKSVVRDTFTTPQDLKAKIASTLMQWAMREKGFERTVNEAVVREHLSIRSEIERLTRENKSLEAKRQELWRQKPRSMSTIMSESTNFLILSLFLALCLIGIAMSQSFLLGLLVAGGLILLVGQYINTRTEAVQGNSYQIEEVEREIASNFQKIQQLEQKSRSLSQE